MRRGSLPVLFPVLWFTLCFGLCVGMAAIAPAVADGGPNGPVAAPQPIPPQPAKDCEERGPAPLNGGPALGCVERRTECPCAAPCRMDTAGGCSAGCPQQAACSRDRQDEPCASASHDGARDGDGRESAGLAPTGLKIDAFALYAEHSLRLGRCDRVDGGSVGVASLADKVQEAQLRIGAHSAIDPRRIVVAPSVKIGAGVTLGFVAANRFRDDGVALGAAAAFPAAQMPPLPLAFGTGTGADVKVGHDQALALQPGHYGTLSVDGVLLLNPGRYWAASVRVGDGGRIVAITGSVEFAIAGTLTVGRHAAIYPDFELPARQFRISVAGYDSDAAPAVSFGENSRVRALLAAPHGSLNFADHTRVTGAFAAFDIAAGEDVRVKFEDGFPANEKGGHGTQQLSGYFVGAIFNAPIVGPVPPSQVISLAIGLPANNPDALRQAAHDAADPASASFRKYLTPSQFAATYGAAQTDYQNVINWAQAQGLTLVATYPNRLLVDVSGTADQIERALYVGLDQRVRPDGSVFYAIDRDPSLNLAAKLLWISGLDNRVIATPGAGSGPGGTYNSRDLRTAYASCTTLTGAGQSVGLFELDGFTPADISAYECQLGGATCTPAGVVTSAVPNVTVVPVDKPTGVPNTVNGSFEVALDIEMAIGVAPGLAQVQVFEAPNTGNAGFNDDVLTKMATTLPLINQLSSSWFFGTDSNTQPALYELALQGQSFVQAAGDQGSSSWGTDPGDIRDLDAVTDVGGTTLTLTGSPSSYGSETTWNAANQGAGGGGIAANTAIPSYQTAVSMSTNGGSTTHRNLPDVSAVATNLGVVSTNPTTATQTTGGAIGTSAAAPVWAGLIALANQQSQSSSTGAGRVGNANAFLYSIGQNAAAYAANFNDIATGNNNGACPGQSGTSSSTCAVTVQNISTGKTTVQNLWAPASGNYSAVAGFDLATGWGSPKCAILNALATGSTTAVSSSSTATITYHQTGACNGFATSSGITSAGPNAAFVVFGIEKLDNSGDAAPFAFDPTRLYVQQAVQNFVDPLLGLYANILGPFAAVPTTVPSGGTIPYSASAQAALVVQTTNANGATEANTTSYFLKYNAAATDPAVLLVKSDALQTSWPDTEDCATILLH